MAEECTSLLGDRDEMNRCRKKYDITSGKVRRINKTSIAIVGVISICGVVFVLLGFGAGVMFGWRFFSSDSDNAAKDKSNWGASVSVDSHSVAIQEWIRDNIVAQNIKDNLR